MTKQRTHTFKDLANIMKLKELYATGKYKNVELAKMFKSNPNSVGRAIKKLKDSGLV